MVGWGTKALQPSKLGEMGAVWITARPKRDYVTVRYRGPIDLSRLRVKNGGKRKTASKAGSKQTCFALICRLAFALLAGLLCFLLCFLLACFPACLPSCLPSRFWIACLFLLCFFVTHRNHMGLLPVAVCHQDRVCKLVCCKNWVFSIQCRHDLDGGIRRRVCLLLMCALLLQ